MSDTPDVRRCPSCGRRVVVLATERKLQHENPTCDGFVAFAKSFGVELEPKPTTDLDAALARAAAGDTPGRA